MSLPPANSPAQLWRRPVAAARLHNLHAVALIAGISAHLLVCSCGEPTHERTWSALGLVEEVRQDARRWGAERPSADVAESEELSGHGAVDEAISLRVLTAPGVTPGAFAAPPDIATPHITLRTNDGGLFGGSIAAMGDILVLGWADRLLSSPDAASGGLFYLNYEDMWGDSPDNAGATVRAFASEDLACFQPRNELGCILLNRNASFTGVPLGASVWVEAPRLRTRQVMMHADAQSPLAPPSSPCTTATPSTCYGIAVGINERAVAVSGRANDGSRYVQVTDLVYNTSDRGVEWRCLSGCRSTHPSGKDGNVSYPAWPLSEIWSEETTYGNAVVFDGSVLAVGAPGGLNGQGFVDVWTAAAMPAPDAMPRVGRNRRFEQWSRATVLSHAGSLNFGGVMMMKNGILVVAAPGGVGANGAQVMSSLHLYSVDVTNGVTRKLCDFWQAGDDFGASLDMQLGRGDRHTVVVGQPSRSRVYAILVTPDQGVQCRMQTLIRQYYDMDITGDGFGSSIGMTHNFLFVGAPLLTRSDAQGSRISGLLHIMALCTEGNYLLPDRYAGCAACPNGKWSTGSQHQDCSSCIPPHSMPLQGCDYKCNAAYFGDVCEPCSQAMSNMQMQKPNASSWVDGRDTCFYQCDLSYERVNNNCIKCAVAAEDYNGVWIEETCNWMCNTTFFAPSASQQPECVACSVLHQGLGTLKPANSEWIDGLSTCQFGPALGYSCSDNACHPCPHLAPNAHWTDLAPQLAPRCGFACDEGFFGHPTFSGVCASCSVFLEQVLPQSQRPTKPTRSEWADGLTCDAKTSWRCVQGTHLSNSNEFCCPDFIENSIKDSSVGPCGVLCVQGFWWDETDALCRSCFTLPQYAFWAEGNCTYRPLAGYTCSGDGCTACPSSLPLNAQYVDDVAADCTYACNTGFFGHPEHQGICELCSVLMQGFSGRPLPRHGMWLDGEVCNKNSWTCGASYTKSETDLYCCPEQRDVNSVPYLQGRPCKLDCNPGYIWSNDEEKCINCPSAPAYSNWTYGCNFKCDARFFGSDIGKCLNCRAWRYETGSSPPLHARWSEDSASCSATDYECDVEYFKSDVASGCCPTALPEGGLWAAPGNLPRQCDIECDAGWSWSETQMTCVGCPQSSYSSAPITAVETYVWDSQGSCSYKCSEKSSEYYYAYPPAPARVNECVTCADFALRMQWFKPDGAEWLATPCQQDSWKCGAGLIKNSKVCCSVNLLPAGVGGGDPKLGSYQDLMNQKRGSWVGDNGCQWRCNTGYFPTIPRPQDRQTNKNCMLCSVYLQENKIPSCYDDRATMTSTQAAWCLGKVVDRMPTECVASISLALSLRGMSVEEFTAAVEVVVRQGIAESVKVPLDQVFVTSVTSQTSNRRADSMVRDNVVRMGVEMRGVEPYAIDQVKVDTRQSLVPAVNVRLQQNSIYASADALLAALDVLGGASSWRCESPKVFNEMTGMCCSKRVDMASNRERYIWKTSGCDWSCRQGFWQMDVGAPCLSCSEYNELNRRFKPPNSHWKDDSQDCSQWACNKGHVRSSSGFSCIELKTLQASCAALPRCAQCVQDGDCVWCKDRCRAGGMNQVQQACSYKSDGSLGDCKCEASTCSAECGHKKCAECVKDDYCGWCASTSTCLLGSYFRPLVSDCPAGTWIATGVSACGSDDSLWLIGLVCATASTLLVACVGGYVVTRVRTAARRDQQRASGQSTEQIELRRQTQRFVSTFPTFKYNGKRLPGSSSDGMPAAAACSGPPVCPAGAGGEERGSNGDDEDDKPMCSICLGEFGDGDELRMLPCLHVFHVACIDQWLGLSHECPLCKRSVVNNTNAHLVASNRQFAEAQSILFTRGSPPEASVTNIGAEGLYTPNSLAPPVAPDGSNNAAGRVSGGRRRVASIVNRFTRGASAEEAAARETARRDVSIEMVSGITVLSPNTSMLPASHAQHPSWHASSSHVWNANDTGEDTSSRNVRQQPESDQREPRLLPPVAGPAPQVAGVTAAGSASARASESNREVHYIDVVPELTPVSPFQYSSADEASPEDGAQEHVSHESNCVGATEAEGASTSTRRLLVPNLLQAGAHAASSSRQNSVAPAPIVMPVSHADEQRISRLVCESAQLAAHREDRDEDEDDGDASSRVSFEGVGVNIVLPHSPSPPLLPCMEARSSMEQVRSTPAIPALEGLAVADSDEEPDSDEHFDGNEIGV